MHHATQSGSSPPCFGRFNARVGNRGVHDDAGGTVVATRDSRCEPMRDIATVQWHRPWRPGHADSSHHWLRRSTGIGAPGHQARRPSDGSHPGHADSSHHWPRRSTGSGTPGIKLDGFEMGPIRPRGQLASLAAPQYRKRGPGHQARRLRDGSHPGHADSSHHWRRRSTEVRAPGHQARRLLDGSHPGHADSCASLAAPQYRKRAPGHQARRPSDGSHPGHADSSHHWLRRSTGSGPRDSAERSSGASDRPALWVPSGHADSSHHCRCAAVQEAGPRGIKLDSFEMGPIPATRTARIIGCTAVQERGPRDSAKDRPERPTVRTSWSHPGHADSSQH